MSLPLRAADANSVAARYRAVRAWTEALCQSLLPEDYVVQSMPDASPAKWHLAHTTWFFETFVLAPRAGYQPFHPLYAELFNSYYEAVGPRHPRPERGLLTRPSVDEVYAYRRAIDAAMLELLDRGQVAASILELGLAHEQQHQELLLTDLQHAFSKNPLRPVYRPLSPAEPLDDTSQPMAAGFAEHAGGIAWIGDAGSGFAFDNERPRHRVIAEPYAIAERLVSAGEYLEFMRDGGYTKPELWLSDGWQWVQQHGVSAPLYWEARDGQYSRYSLHGMLPLARELEQPVCHVSFFEADAFARWAGARLPTEAEWELSYADRTPSGQFAQAGVLVPRHTASPFGSAWVWTASPYVAYPGFQAEAGALGEYNGKFMCNQLVLRGGSCFTPDGHLRATYRNFFPPTARWQVSGIRLAR